MGGGVGGSKRKRPNDVVGEKIDMFVAPEIYEFSRKHYPKIYEPLRMHTLKLMKFDQSQCPKELFSKMTPQNS